MRRSTNKHQESWVEMTLATEWIHLWILSFLHLFASRLVSSRLCGCDRWVYYVAVTQLGEIDAGSCEWMFGRRLEAGDNRVFGAGGLQPMRSVFICFPLSRQTWPSQTRTRTQTHNLTNSPTQWISRDLPTQTQRRYTIQQSRVRCFPPFWVHFQVWEVSRILMHLISTKNKRILRKEK